MRSERSRITTESALHDTRQIPAYSHVTSCETGTCSRVVATEAATEMWDDDELTCFLPDRLHEVVAEVLRVELLPRLRVQQESSIAWVGFDLGRRKQPKVDHD